MVQQQLKLNWANFLTNWQSGFNEAASSLKRVHRKFGFLTIKSLFIPLFNDCKASDPSNFIFERLDPLFNNFTWFCNKNLQQNYDKLKILRNKNWIFIRLLNLMFFFNSQFWMMYLRRNLFFLTSILGLKINTRAERITSDPSKKTSKITAE